MLIKKVRLNSVHVFVHTVILPPPLPHLDKHPTPQLNTPPLPHLDKHPTPQLNTPPPRGVHKIGWCPQDRVVSTG